MITSTLIYQSGIIDATLNETWRIIRDFHKVDQFHKLVQSLEVVRGNISQPAAGDIRKLFLAGGGEVSERLEQLDDQGKSISYSMLNPPFEVTEFLASVRLLPVTESGQTFMEYKVSFNTDPNQVASILSIVKDANQAAFDGLNQLLS